jgi:hypothetical protein
MSMRRLEVPFDRLSASVDVIVTWLIRRAPIVGTINLHHFADMISESSMYDNRPAVNLRLDEEIKHTPTATVSH